MPKGVGTNGVPFANNDFRPSDSTAFYKLMAF